jgi:transposase InsO family protein
MQASPSLQIVSRKAGGVELLGDISTGMFRPLLPPAAFRTAAIRTLHEIHHPGVRATTKLVKAAFCWPKMGRDISAVAKSCLGCQLGKVHRHVTLQPEAIPVPHRRFSHLHVDLVGPLPQSDGYNYLFTIIDRTTRWPEAVPLSSTTAADCATALLTGWIQRFGVPSTITSDRGPQFTSTVCSSLCKLLDIKHTPTTAYHPQSNGIVERFHRRLKDAMRARAVAKDWSTHLPLIMLGIRSAWRPDSEFRQRKRSVVPSHCYLASFSPPRTLHRRPSCPTFNSCWRTEQHHQQLTTTLQPLFNFQRTCSRPFMC